MEQEVRAKERLDVLIDPCLVARIERRAAASLVRREDLPRPTYVRAPRILLDPVNWRVGFLAARERTIPPELFRDLEELTPQALLRDLFRPGYCDERFERQPPCEPLDLGGRRALKECKAALVRASIPTVEPGVHAVEAELMRRRRFLVETWMPIRGDHEPRRLIEESIEPSLSY